MHWLWLGLIFVAAGVVRLLTWYFVGRADRWARRRPPRS
jgi:uncharacterized membrane protein HdeD (DUF308 family)